MLHFAYFTKPPKYSSTILSFILLFLLSACGSVTYNPIPDRTGKAEHVFSKNYKIGDRVIAYVGNPIVRVRDYWTVERETNRVLLETGFEARGENIYVKSDPGDSFQILGTINLEGETYTAYMKTWTELPSFTFYVGNNGKIYNKVHTVPNPFNGKNVPITITPENFKFPPNKIKEVLSQQGSINFEILYSGRDTNSIRAVYREFTPDNLAKPAFYQDLTFPVDSKTIRYKNISIVIHSVDSEKLDYTVMND